MDRLNQWIAIFANIGVLIGLVFVGFEVRQNSQATRAQTLQNVLEDLRLQFDYPETVAGALFKPADELTDSERFQLRLYFVKAMRSYENQWYNYDEGLLDPQLYDAYLTHVRITLGNSAMRELWDHRKQIGYFHPRFVEFIDGYLREHGTLTSKDINPTDGVWSPETPSERVE